MSEPAKPLQGLVVIAIEQAVAAPLCTVRLADAGARVIKIERLEGETARNYDATVQGMSAYFVWLNRGKESTALDLKSDGDLALLHRMVAKADVLVQNLAPGAIDRLGLASRELADKFPQLIMVNIVGYGQDTAYANMRAYDMLVQAESGICSVTGTPDQPCKVGVSAADIATGMNAYAAILEALIERQQIGRGRVIEIAMFDGMADWMAVPMLHFEHAGQETGRHGLAHASIYPYRPFVCKSGGAVVISIQQNSEWSRFCSQVLERPELFSDMRFTSNSSRVANRTALDAEIEPIFASMDCEEAIRRLEAAQIAWGRLTEACDLPQHPALRHMKVALPTGETIIVPRPSGWDGRRSGLPKVPALGADTDKIRAEFSH
jgi:crotonobetainyl-CoA:carnitine CoA-transferase CaiB-like acyl-CoA transferase